MVYWRKVPAALTVYVVCLRKYHKDRLQRHWMRLVVAASVPVSASLWQTWVCLQKTDDYIGDEDVSLSVRGESAQSIWLQVGQSSPEDRGNE